MRQFVANNVFLNVILLSHQAILEWQFHLSITSRYPASSSRIVVVVSGMQLTIA